MGDWSGCTQPHIAEGECQRDRCERKQHQNPEDIYRSQERRLYQHLLSDPSDGLLLCLLDRAALGGKIVHQLLHCVLVLPA